LPVAKAGAQRALPRTVRILAMLLFGAATALQFLFQSLRLTVPYQFFLMLPYLLTLLALAGVVGRVRAPAALAAEE